MVTSNHIHPIAVDGGGRDVIPKSIKLVAGRTGQEYNFVFLQPKKETVRFGKTVITQLLEWGALMQNGHKRCKTGNAELQFLMFNINF